MARRYSRRDRRVSTVWRLLPDGSGVERVTTTVIPACARGHALTAENTVIRAYGTRLVCRECERERSRGAKLRARNARKIAA